MTHLSPPGATALALGLATVLATFTQCGDGRATGPTAADPAPAGPAEGGGGGQDPARAQVPAPPDSLRILISGSMLGHLEPCGCASGQLGGLARRVQHIGEQRTYDLLLEGGDLAGGGTELDALKLFASLTVLVQMANYDALGVGAKDLTVARDEWKAFLAGSPVVTTNLRSDEPDWPGKPFVEKTVRTHTVRIGSLLLDPLPAPLQAHDSPVRRVDPAEAWQAAFADAPASTLRIVMLQGDDAVMRALLPRLEPPPDLAIGVDADYIEPTTAPAMVGPVPLVFTGIRGRVLLDLRLWRDGSTPRVAAEEVPLPGSKTVPGGGGDPQVRDVLLEHRRDVKDLGVLQKMARQHPTPGGAAYVGNDLCKNCHQTAWASWSKSRHAHAWQTLVDAEQDPKRYGWPVTAYPECVGCHTVGYGQETGFVSFDATPQLADVGCERCHGPGSDHLATGGKTKLGIIGGVAASVSCTQCHDFEQSPNFVYGEKWKLIEHGREPNQQK